MEWRTYREDKSKRLHDDIENESSERLSEEGFKSVSRAC